MRALNVQWGFRTVGLRVVAAALSIATPAVSLWAVPPGNDNSSAASGRASVLATTMRLPEKQAPTRRSVSGSAPVQTPVSDEVLQARVRLALEDDPQTRSFAEHATVHDGRVTLTGETYHPEQRALAESIVRHITGVQDLQDRILIEHNSDLEIAHKLHAAFSSDLTIDDAAIGVSVIHGRVALSGTADSPEDVTRINSIVLNTPGVVSVSNGLQVSPSTVRRRVPQVGRTYSTYPGIRR